MFLKVNINIVFDLYLCVKIPAMKSMWGLTINDFRPAFRRTVEILTHLFHNKWKRIIKLFFGSSYFTQHRTSDLFERTTIVNKNNLCLHIDPFIYKIPAVQNHKEANSHSVTVIFTVNIGFSKFQGARQSRQQQIVF